MRAHIEALQALIPVTSYFVDVPSSPVYPYALLWTSSGSPGPDECLAGLNRDVDAMVGVTVVAGTPTAVLDAQDLVRAVLNPDGGRRELDVPGRKASVKLFDSRPVDVDREVKIPVLNRHPATGVDLYRLASTPISALPTT